MPHNTSVVSEPDPAHLSFSCPLERGNLCECYDEHGHRETDNDEHDHVYPRDEVRGQDALKVRVAEVSHRCDGRVNKVHPIEGEVEDRVAVYVSVVGDHFCNVGRDGKEGEVVDQVSKYEEEHWKSRSMHHGTEQAQSNHDTIQT